MISNITNRLTLPHEFRSVDFGPGSDNFTLTNPFLRSRRRERLLKIDGKVYIFEEDRFDCHTPFLSGCLNLTNISGIPRPVTYNFGDFMGETLSIGNDALEDLCDDERGIGSDR